MEMGFSEVEMGFSEAFKKEIKKLLKVLDRM